MMKHTNGDAAIRITDLRKSFGSQTVLNRVNLQVAPGETLVVLGRSGTGKSVLLRLLIGLLRPDSGSIRMLGQEITGLSEDPLNEVRKKVGFVFQYAALYDSLTVAENVEFPLKYHTGMTARQRRESAIDILSRVGMDNAAAKMPTEISGGMKKRVGLARALALEPDIMLYDEPTAGLDPITSGEIDELILALQQERKMSSIVVTHEMYSAGAIADRVALLNEGNVVFDGKFDDLKHCDDQFVSHFVRSGGGQAVPSAAGLKSLSGPSRR
jgi:phospholipid/cholesterol/gamma-HCH transport system ATP-binding protein